ncbi:MAG TPA: TIR domain-containing protein [Aggregatilineaceae bacterium]|nr:TIR domain-containing protein [Aggregatilineaceae bacterium]
MTDQKIPSENKSAVPGEPSKTLDTPAEKPAVPAAVPPATAAPAATQPAKPAAIIPGTSPAAAAPAAVQPESKPGTPSTADAAPAKQAGPVASKPAEAVIVDDLEDELDEDEDDLDKDVGIEAYCVKCKTKVTMDNPEPVWTSKGTPGTRGTCPQCGTIVFRMGKTPAHDALVRPAAVKVEGNVKIATAGGRKRAQPATYINHAPADSEFARKLATDLENAGVHTWIDTGEPAPKNVKWAGGVHPALKDSARMVVVLSPTGKDNADLTKAWTFFKTQKKPIVVAMTATVEVPDPLRRSPRFDFSADYKAALRQLMSVLSD